MTKAEPRLIDLERRAYRYRGSRDIWNAYSALKRDLERLAGWECSRIELATPRHYDVALQRIAKALGV